MREPNVGPGLLMIEGCQFQFSRDVIGKSEIAPKAGSVVEVELDQNQRVIAIKAVEAVKEYQSAMPREKSEDGIWHKLIAKFGKN